MNELTFGTPDKRELTLLFGGRFRWLDWGFYFQRATGMTHRCYCPAGYLVDGHLRVCGFQLTWFYSFYNGPVPCSCDKVLAALHNSD